MGAGACIALSAGHGVALADTDSATGATSGAQDRATSQPARESTSATAKKSTTDKSATTRKGTARKGTTQRETDSAAEPSSSSLRGSSVRDAARASSKSVITLQRQTARAERAAAKADRESADVERDSTDTAEPATQTHPVTKAEPTIQTETEAEPKPEIQTEAAAKSKTASEADRRAPVRTRSRDVQQAPSPATPESVSPTPEPTTVETTTEALPAAATEAHSPGPVTTMVLNLLSTLGLSRPEAAALPVAWTGAVTTGSAASTAAAGTVTGVQTGHSSLTIPVGSSGYTTRADWYFPTQADGSVAATGVIWLQHGFLADKSWYSALAKSLAQQTNSIVVAPNVPSFGLFCSGCSLNDAAIQQGAASMFLGDQEGLNASAIAAGYQGTLPENFILAGHSAGGGFAAAVAGYYASDPTNERRLRGVVMFDGVARTGVLERALQSLADPYIPIYQIAAPPQAWNAFGATTAALVAARPGDFVGVTLAGGSHVDSLLGANPIIDFFAQLITRFSPPGNTAAVYTLANGWINDLYQGLGPVDGTGIYGAPDQYIVLGNAAAVVLAPAPSVDLDQYLGTWYEVGSVKQFFSLGLVNTTADYSLNPDGSVRVVNSGNYFVNNGPLSRIVGVALPVNALNNKLNVQFFFPASARPPGNYWIVDLDPDYQWAIVSDPTGLSGFLLSRTPVVSDELYRELLNRASVKGVKGWITRTRQPAATSEMSSVLTADRLVI